MNIFLHSTYHLDYIVVAFWWVSHQKIYIVPNTNSFAVPDCASYRKRSNDNGPLPLLENGPKLTLLNWIPNCKEKDNHTRHFHNEIYAPQTIHAIVYTQKLFAFFGRTQDTWTFRTLTFNFFALKTLLENAFLHTHGLLHKIHYIFVWRYR